MLFGVGDFVGGYASRRAPVVSIVLTSQFVGGSGILIAAWVVFDGTLTATGLAWGAAAGLAGGAGLVALYHALATTRMGPVLIVGVIKSESEAEFPASGRQFLHRVTSPWCGIDDIKIGGGRVIHGKAIMMFSHRACKFCS